VALLRAEEEAKVRESFADLARPVELFVALEAGSVAGEAGDARPETPDVFGVPRPEETPRAGAGDIDFGVEMVRLCEALAELGERVTCRVEEEPDGFPRFPAVSIRPDGRDRGVRYDGLPWGYELSSLVGAIVDAGREASTLRPESRTALATLDRDLALEVFVTPT
jgi:hypothetical protein